MRLALTTTAALLGFFISIGLVLGARTDIPLIDGGPRPQAGLVGWWPGNGDARDVIGHDNGTVFSGVDITTAMHGGGFLFDGSHGRINVPDGPAFRLTQSLSIECWLSIAELPTERNECKWAMIFFRGDDRGGLDPYFIAIRPDSTIVFHIEDANGQIAELATAIVTNRFVHVAATLNDADGEMRVYLDGHLAAQRTTSVRPLAYLDHGANPCIGIGNHGGYPKTPHNMPFCGVIDELRVYNRALRESEVQQIFYATGGRSRDDRTNTNDVHLSLISRWNGTGVETATTSAPVANTATSDIRLTPLSDSSLHIFPAIELTWPSETNKVYRVQWIPSLSMGEWTNLDPLISGTGTNVSMFDSTREHPNGFYRVMRLEP